MSVVMEKCVAAYQDDAAVISAAIPTTGQANRAQISIARTTAAVILFMGPAEFDGQKDRNDRLNYCLSGQEKGKTGAASSAFLDLLQNRVQKRRLDARKSDKREITDNFPA